MNKKRLLELLRILIKNSDSEHKLSLNDIVDKLSEKDITVNNRKTLYDDIRILNESGIDVEYDNGYYLESSPFSLSEIKIMIDSLNSLKNLDYRFLDRLKDKIYSFVSDYDMNFLNRYEYSKKHSDKNFINRLEDVLHAIRCKRAITIKRKNRKTSEDIEPLFLYRNNDYYYLYYVYTNSEKIYHLRFDNLISVNETDTAITSSISKSTILANIEESTDSFYGQKSEFIEIEILDESVKEFLTDDFPNAFFTKEGISIKASISDMFFSKLAGYGNKIKISNLGVAEKYTDFLNRILDNY